MSYSESPSYPSIIHHGGATGVTGSCHELRSSERAGILIDCGLFQGEERPDGRNAGGRGIEALEIDFPVEHIKALVLTHAHIDHAGRIPWLFAAGYKGPIYCSEPTALILPIMLRDAFEVGISDSRYLASEYIKELERRLIPVPYKTWRAIPTGDDTAISIRLVRAGHILGSAYLQCKVRLRSSASKRATVHVVFSGDLGAPYAPILPAPKSPYRADVLVLESTYGDRLHEGRKDRRKRLLGVIESALKDRGTVLIPAFALGRTQELLYELEGLIRAHRRRRAGAGIRWDELEIVLDSPLATEITQAYRELSSFWDAEALRRVRYGRHPLAFEQLTVVQSHADHLNTVGYLKRTGRPCVVIAASGMCTGGRIVNYLKELVGDEKTDVVFIGYQAAGTPGRAIQRYGPSGGYVEIDGKRYTIRARIHTISGYSAHADQRNLVAFVRRMRRRPSEIRLVHGEAGARASLSRKLRRLSSSIFTS